MLAHRQVGDHPRPDSKPEDFDPVRQRLFAEAPDFKRGRPEGDIRVIGLNKIIALDDSHMAGVPENAIPIWICAPTLNRWRSMCDWAMPAHALPASFSRTHLQLQLCDSCG
jgi:hypothetical protein